MSNKSLYQDSSTGVHSLVIICALVMVGLSIYMTSHYFTVHFPTNLDAGSMCDINAFFNCDVATNSPMAALFNVPIALFGVFVGAFILFGYIFQTEKFEGTTHFLVVSNTVGCFILLCYSLLALGGLCPFCTIYYICSFIITYLFYKNSTFAKPDFKVAAGFATVVIIAGGITASFVADKADYLKKLAPSLIKQFDSLPDLGAPDQDSAYRLASATENFKDAPIQITEFSDFQCPACKALSKITKKLKKKYKGKMNVQYMFYPLDHNCHPDIKRQLHTLACKAAYLASCLPQKFSKVHDDIFDNQGSLTSEWLDNYARKEGVLDCMSDPNTKAKVQKSIAAAAAFNVRSTPTILINGVKVEGARPLPQLYIILDHILKKANGGK